MTSPAFPRTAPPGSDNGTPPPASRRQRRARAPLSLLEDHHTRRLVASQLRIRVEDLRGTEVCGGEREARDDLAQLLDDVVTQLRAQA